MFGDPNGERNAAWPDWVPTAVRHYLSHTEGGLSIRELARQDGRHASTLLRQIRRYESRRDDPLVDAALAELGKRRFRGADTEGGSHAGLEETDAMTMPVKPGSLLCDEATVAREGRRILRRLAEPGAVLAVAPGMEKAAVLRDTGEGSATRTAVVDGAVAQAFALKEWIACKASGKVARYTITAAGRAALKRMLAEQEADKQPGFAEAPSSFAAQHASYVERDVEEDGRRRRVRYNMAESPIVALSRRREKDGAPFLKPELVAAAERLREDFELAQMGPRVAQNWEGFLTGGTRGSFGPTGPGNGSDGARSRVAKALRDLGPGLGDMVLRCCCFLEGLEATEKRMGWSARSGKIVLRIALMRLARHYEDEYGPGGGMIG